MARDAGTGNVALDGAGKDLEAAQRRVGNDLSTQGDCLRFAFAWFSNIIFSCSMKS